MSSPTTAFVSQMEGGSLILRPHPRWFLIRGIPFGLLLVLVLGKVAGSGVGGLLLMVCPVFLWLMYKTTSMTLGHEGFTYRWLGRNITHRWVDVEGFYVVEQRAYGFITMNRYLGWKFTPSYKNYKLLAIPRAMARFAGMTDAMVKPMGFEVRELTRLMNERLLQSRGVSTSSPYGKLGGAEIF